MKIIKQLAIILSFYFVGEIIVITTGIPVPGSVLGMAFMLVALLSGKLKIEHIEETSGFMLANLPILFVPPVAGLIDAFPLMKDSLLGILVVVLVGMVFITVVTGLIVQALAGKGQQP